jgi:cyclophilin family peptidyl-prolyl cis-trans isomerase
MQVCAGFHSSAHASRGSKNLDWYFNALDAVEKRKAHVEPPVFPKETLHGKKRARAYLDFAFGRDSNDGAANAQRVVVELADDIVPTTVSNFLTVRDGWACFWRSSFRKLSICHRLLAPRAEALSPPFPACADATHVFPSPLHLQLCERPAGQGYVNSEVFRVQKTFGIFAGDWQRKDGTGGVSAFAAQGGASGGVGGGARFFADENFIGRHAAPGVLAMANHGVHTNNSVFYITTAKASHLGAYSRMLWHCCSRPSLPLPSARLSCSLSHTRLLVHSTSDHLQMAATSSSGACCRAWTW